MTIKEMKKLRSGDMVAWVDPEMDEDFPCVNLKMITIHSILIHSSLANIITTTEGDCVYVFHHELFRYHSSKC